MGHDINTSKQHASATVNWLSLMRIRCWTDGEIFNPRIVPDSLIFMSSSDSEIGYGGPCRHRQTHSSTACSSYSTGRLADVTSISEISDLWKIFIQ